MSGVKSLATVLYPGYFSRLTHALSAIRPKTTPTLFNTRLAVIRDIENSRFRTSRAYFVTSPTANVNSPPVSYAWNVVRVPEGSICWNGSFEHVVSCFLGTCTARTSVLAATAEAGVARRLQFKTAR